MIGLAKKPGNLIERCSKWQSILEKVAQKNQNKIQIQSIDT